MIGRIGPLGNRVGKPGRDSNVERIETCRGWTIATILLTYFAQIMAKPQ
ncbi:hypothetical protein KPATCC21470_5140 [Kitasatospora purpeofusca]